MVNHVSVHAQILEHIVELKLMIPRPSLKSLSQ